MLQKVPPRPQVTPQVYLLLGRATIVVDNWLRELQTAEDMLAFARALGQTVQAREDGLELALKDRAPRPAV